jgi:ribonuclease VapC
VIAIDASAVLAILLDEPEGSAFGDIVASRGGVISPVNYWEVVVRAFQIGGDAAASDAERFFPEMDVRIAHSSAGDARLAFAAYRRFGKGVGGRLNLGDCFAYALAQSEGDGLLFKGDDFRTTDVKPVL